MPVLLLETSVEEGARSIALHYLDQIASAAARLDDASDAEALHDVRVAMRRLRSWLRAFEDVLDESVGDKGQRRLSRLASSTNPGRDSEVLLEWVEKLGANMSARHRAGVQFLAGDLAARRDRAYADVQRDLRARLEKLDARLRSGLETYTVTMRVGTPNEPKPFAQVIADAIEEQLALAIKDLVRLSSEDDDKIIHRARIHGKRLRYLLEPLRPELEPAKDAVRSLRVVQDLLGDLHDLHNLALETSRAIEQAAVDRARQLAEAVALPDGGNAVAQALRADERPGLLALVKRVQTDRAALLASVRGEWLAPSGSLAALRAKVEEVLDAVRAASRRKDVEIERKYLLSALPPFCEGREPARIDQGYVPGERLIERVRRTRRGDEEKYVRTVKLGRGVLRIEVEEACAKHVFEQLWGLTKGRRVKKRRYAIEEGARTWEIDAFEDRELFLAEIELESADEAIEFPEWLAPYVVREVTDDSAYVNANLAC
jgi:CHAD domain-containing protein/CYTH domain-containing protein